MNSILAAWTKPAAAVIFLLVVLINAYSVCHSEYSSAIKSATGADVVNRLRVSVNDFNVAHQAASSKSVLEVPILPFQTERLLRSNIFDYAVTFLLTLTLTRFVRPAYFTSLSPKWYPSIPIAYRRLII